MEPPTLGMVLYPDVFIPIAERVGLMPKLTRAVLDLAIAEAGAARPAPATSCR